LPVPGEAVGLVARLAKRRHTVLRRPPPEVVARHVAPQEVLARGMAERSLREETVAGDLLEVDLRAHDGREAWVANLHRHFLIGSPGLPRAYQSVGFTFSTTTPN